MKKGIKNWRELVIQKCTIQLRLKRAWADFTSRNPHVTCNDITKLLDQIEHINILIKTEKPFDINSRIYGSGSAVCDNDSSRYII